jgi:hypothetical protein
MGESIRATSRAMRPRLAGRCPDDRGDDRQEPSCCVEPRHGADRSHRIRVGSTARRSPASTTPVLEPGFYVSGSKPCSASSPGWAM